MSRILDYLRKEKKKTLALEGIIILEVSIIILLCNSFFHRNLITGRSIEINALNESNLIFYNETNLEHFREPAPNERIVESLDLIGKRIVKTTNNDSLFDDENYSIKKPEGVYRVVTLGDSFTTGVLVNLSDNYPERLEGLLNNYSGNCEKNEKFQVINLGVRGYDIQYSLKRFKKRGLKYNPDLVTLYIKSDDFLIFSELWGDFTENISFPSREKHKEFKKAWENKTQEYVSFLQEEYNESFLDRRYILGPIKELCEVTKRKNIDLLIFTHFSSKSKPEKIRNLVNKYPHANYIGLNISPKRWNRNLTIYYNEEKNKVIEPHPNERGHKIIASRLFDFIKLNFLKEC